MQRRPQRNVRRYTALLPKHEECYQCCGGDGACTICGGDGKVDDAICPQCRGNGRCILCRGAGQIPLDVSSHSNPAYL